MNMEKRRIQVNDHEEIYHPKKRLHRSFEKDQERHSKKKSEDLDPDEYEVEAILDIRRDEVTGKRISDENTWEPQKNLNCPEKIKEYLIKNKDKISSKHLKSFDARGKHPKPIFTEEQFQKKLNELQNKISYKNRMPRPMSPRTKNMIKRYDDERERMIQQEKIEKEVREKEERDRKMWEELKSIKPRKYSQLKGSHQEDNDSDDSESYSPSAYYEKPNELNGTSDSYLITPSRDLNQTNNNHSTTSNPSSVDISYSAPTYVPSSFNNLELSELLSKIRHEELLKSLRDANINISAPNLSSVSISNQMEQEIGEALSEREGLVIESTQPMKFLWRIFEEDMKRSAEDRALYPLYTIFTVTAPLASSNSLDHESRELRKLDQVSFFLLDEWVGFLLPTRPSLCNQLRIPIPHEVFLLIGYRKYVFPVNFLVNWPTHMLSTFEDSKYTLIGKKFIENDNLLRFLNFLNANETFVNDPHLEIVM
ncbi:16365_t:CDS:2, partial [Acaulospora colombiana]